MRERELFLAALEIESTDQRAEFLRHACADDPALQMQVESLMRAHKDVGSLLEPKGLPEEGVAVLEGTGLPLPPQDVERVQESLRPSKVLNGDQTTRSLAGAVVATKTPVAAPKLAGQFGRYHIKKVLGQGGMGSVYLAFDTRLGRDVALKIPQLLGHPNSSEMVARFQREARAAATLHHPNICPVYDVDEIDGVHYLTMRFVEGKPLSKFVVRDKPQNPRAVAAVVRKLASALEEAHKNGIVHRDLKPSNVMLDARNEPVLMDFGLARQIDAKRELQLTESGMILGTAWYMSPEQVTGDARRIGPQSDVWGLGVILFELLTGRLPFEGNLLEVIGAIQYAEIPQPSQFRKELPPELDAICRKMLLRETDLRYKSMEEVGRDLAAFLKERKGEVEKPATTATAPTTSYRPPEEESPRSEFEFDDLRLSQERGVARRVNRTGISKGRSDRGNDRGLTWKAMVGAAGCAAVLACIVIIIINRNGSRIRIDMSQAAVMVNADEPNETSSDSATKDGQRVSTPPVPTVKPPQDDESPAIAINESSVEDIQGGEKAMPPETLDVPVKAPMPSSTKPALETSSWPGWPKSAPAQAIAPFNAKKAKKHQDEWAAYLKVPAQFTNSIGMKFRLIPPGEFLMGSTPVEIERALLGIGEDRLWQDSFKSEGPQHIVVLTRPYYLGVFEVTQLEYFRVTKTNPAAFSEGGHGKDHVKGMNTSSFPVEMVSWIDAVDFCNTLGSLEKFGPGDGESDVEGRPWAASGYRLATEAEWEFACRAGTTTKYWNGDLDTALRRSGWCLTNSGGRTHAAGELAGNPFGLFDLYGNVFEWVHDSWVTPASEVRRDRVTIDPQGDQSGSSLRLMRGGFWQGNEAPCRSSARYANIAGLKSSHIGFRVALVTPKLCDAILEKANQARNTDSNSK